MGFEPFIPPKRVVPPAKVEGTREERVLALAKLLHARGITSSLTDAKRLAEGMVDVERKVMKQAPKEEPKPNNQLPSTEAPSVAKPSFGLSLSEDFAHFVAKAATMTHEETQSNAPVSKIDSISYGRETLQTISEVPHVTAHKQVFFAEAPDLTQARGYKGKAEFSSQRQEVVDKLQAVTRVETAPQVVKVTRVESAPQVEVVEETLMVEEPDLPEKTVELPKSDKPVEREDLAKKHGVDIFEMFKKK
jgi:hypothetical protein